MPERRPGRGRRMRFSSGKIFLLLIFFIPACGWLGSDANRLDITIRNEAAKLTDVSVIAGPDKFWWPEIEPDEKARVSLFVNKKFSPNVTLIYTLNGEKKTWESGNLTTDTDRVIELTVGPDGAVGKTIRPR